MADTGRGYIQAAIDMVEDRVGKNKPLPTVMELSIHIGYSVHHFSRLFSAVTGLAPSDYIQRRALSSAAESFRNKRLSLRAIAENCGFSNYEVFNRAFRRHFGLSPQQARNDPAHFLPLTPPLRLAAASHALASLEPQIIVEPERTIAGMWFFMDGSETSFHRPWGIFTRHAGQVRSVSEPKRWYQYAASCDTDDKALNILCALECDGGHKDIQSPFFATQTLPAGTYLRFVHTGGLEHLGASYQYIYGDYLANRTEPLAHGWEFQRFGDSSDALEIIIPLSTC